MDSILEAQDLNQDGLLEPSELLLAAHQGQAPGLFATPSEEHGIEQQALPELEGEAAGAPDSPGQQSTAEAPATLKTFQEEQGRVEAPSLTPPGWEADQEAPMDTQGQGAETPLGQGG